MPTGGSAWSSLSDRNVKANFALEDGQEVLARLAKIPIHLWTLQGQEFLGPPERLRGENDWPIWVKLDGPVW
ncbi:MAG TPA: hypothetical protein EYH31_14060 [Anaerolineae bacterium]|nr:hypothetical protein [Anaerolineae bacterium]